MADKMMRIAGRTSGGTAVPMLAGSDGSISTTRKWNVVQTEIFNENISDTENHTMTVVDVSEYPIVSLRITNRTGVPVTIIPKMDLNSGNNYDLIGSDGSSLGIVIPHSANYCIITPNDAPWLNYLHYLKLRVIAAKTPTAQIPLVNVTLIARV